jgi:hypothetical protein
MDIQAQHERLKLTQEGIIVSAWRNMLAVLRRMMTINRRVCEIVGFRSSSGAGYLTRPTRLNSGMMFSITPRLKRCDGVNTLSRFGASAS